MMLLDDFSGREKELYLFVFQSMVVSSAQTRQRQMIGWLASNEMERSVTTWNFLKAAKYKYTMKKPQGIEIVLKQCRTYV
jgi:hypothetical protein